ncbi:hypothetical protein T492DRAFT_847175 [Pavlovales sp. CCMP2436]|nr:hypothetical protein T492DRAFT_847175 [Pavlovales sp. CCMP2436]
MPAGMTWAPDTVGEGLQQQDIVAFESSASRAAGGAKVGERPEIYVTNCPACFEGVHFTLLRDSNNLCCPTCTNLFDATVAYKQAEVLAAIAVQKNVRGCLVRKLKEMRHEAATMGARAPAPEDRQRLEMVLPEHSTVENMGPASPVAQIVDRFRAASPMSVLRAALVRPKLYVTSCPACFEGVHFSLLRDSNNLCCPTCMCMFDATLIYRQTEFHSVESIAVKHILGLRPASPMSRNAEVLVTRCPACFAGVHFSLLRDSNNLCCPTCTSLFDASGAYRQAEFLAAINLQRRVRGRLARKFAGRIVATVRIQKHMRGQLVRIRSNVAALVAAPSPPAAALAKPPAPKHPTGPLPVLPPLPLLLARVLRPADEYECRCPACLSAVRFSLVRDSNNLCCPTCTNLFDAAEHYKVAEVLSAIHIQKHQRGQRDRTTTLHKRAFANKLLANTKISVVCPNCSSSLSFTPHRGDKGLCPHCTYVFEGSAAFKARSVPVLAALRMQRFARGHIVRTCVRQSRLGTRISLLELVEQEGAEAAQAQAPPTPPTAPIEKEAYEEAEAEVAAAAEVQAAMDLQLEPLPLLDPLPLLEPEPPRQPPLPPELPPPPELVASVCPHCERCGAFELHVSTSQLHCPRCLRSFTEADVETRAAAAAQIQRHLRGFATRERAPAQPAPPLEPEPEPAWQPAPDRRAAAVEVQRYFRGKATREMLKALRRSMRPSQLVRARSAVTLGRRAPPRPRPQTPPSSAARVRPGSAGVRATPNADSQLGATRLNMARPSSARALQRLPLAVSASSAGPTADGLLGQALGQTFPRRRPGTSPGRRRNSKATASGNGNGTAPAWDNSLHISIDDLLSPKLRSRATSAERIGVLGASMPLQQQRVPPSPLPRDAKRGRERMELIAQIYGISYTKGPRNTLNLEKTLLPRFNSSK